MEAYLSDKAKYLIKNLREESYKNVVKAQICDAMCVITLMYQMHASNQEKEELSNALDALTNYNELVTELAKGK